MGACSTQRSLTSETGLDALRLLYEVRNPPARPFEMDGWHGGGFPALGLLWLERKGGTDGLLAPDEVRRRATEAWELADAHFTLTRERGVSRADFTTTR